MFIKKLGLLVFVKASELIGTVASIIFAAVILLSFASNPPLYAYWGDSVQRLAKIDMASLGTAIGDYIWVNFFPALMGLLMVVITLILGLSALLRGD